MLTQIIHWLEYAGTALDTLLLVRIVALRLQRAYTFITLLSILTIFFDAADLWFGGSSDVGVRIFIYSRFLYIFLYPLVAWDVFEEMKERIGKLRRVAITRLVSGLFFTLVIALVLITFGESGDHEGGESSVVASLAIILWAGASSASFAFLLTMNKILRLQELARPHNTAVWMRYFQLSFAAEVVGCFLILLNQFLRARIFSDVSQITLNVYGITITAWCVWKLRRIPSETVGEANEKQAV